MLAESAARREETRGSHWREDFPATDDEHWRARQIAQATGEGLRVTRRPVDVPADFGPARLAKNAVKEDAS